MNKFALGAVATAFFVVTPATASELIDFVGGGTSYNGGSGAGVVAPGGATNFLFVTSHFAASQTFDNGGLASASSYSFDLAYQYSSGGMQETAFFNIFLNGSQIGSFSIAAGAANVTNSISGSGTFGPVDLSTGIQVTYRVAQNVTGGAGSVRFFDQGSAFSVDGARGAVPEPATWAMLMVGFGLLGGTMRSRRRTVHLQIA